MELRAAAATATLLLGLLQAFLSAPTVAASVVQRDLLRAGSAARSLKFVPGTTSKYWGVGGELWDPASRLSDFSYAGAYMGEKPVPPAPSGTTLDLVRDFGANGADSVSDADALIRAINALKSGQTLTIPAGRFIIDKQIIITKSISIRGAGRDKTVFYMPKSFNDLQPWTWTSAQPTSPYSDGPCFISFQGGLALGDTTRLATVAASAKRGDRSILVTFAAGKTVSPGAVVRIVASDNNDGKLVDYLYGGLGAKDWGRPSALVGDNNILKFHTPIGAVTPGPRAGTWQLELKKPLAYDLRPGEWRAVEVHAFSSGALYNAGISDVAIEFPPTLYAGHRLEKGYNALLIQGCVHCWATGIRIVNHDLGISIYNTVFSTVQDVVMLHTIDRTGGRSNQPYGAHHQIRMAHSNDVLAQDITLNAKAWHDVSFDHLPSHNVYHNIQGPDLAIDFHGDAPNGNLHSRINCGACTRPWNSGGADDSGGHAGIHNVMWGLTGSNPGIMVPAMPLAFAPNYTAIGYVSSPSAIWYNNFTLENVDPVTLQPWDLHAAMLSRRLATGYRVYG